VFLVIAGTVVAAGLAAWPLAALLRLRLPARDRIAILGAQGLGIALGRELRDAGRTVVFVDADPQRCRLVEDDGFSVVFGDALRERTLRRIPVELVGTVIGATYNDNLNSQFVGLARQTFGVKVGLVLVDSLEGERAPQHVTRHGADVLFGAPHDQERWDVYWRQGQVEILKVVWAEGERQPAEAAPRARADVFALLTLERGGRTVPMSLSVTPRKGDLAAVAVHTARREEALAQLEGLGWSPAAAAEPESATPEAT
jgi:hypothetical protein